MNEKKEAAIFRILEKVMTVIMIGSSIILTIMIGVSVYIRYVLHDSFRGNEELITLFAMWLYWIGAAYGSYEDTHITASKS